MRNLINDTPAKRNYTFIDNIRCIAMMGIVADHAFNVGDYIFKTHSASFWAYGINIQLAKFGTITFFLLAGFLLGDKFAEYTPAQYLKRRFKNTFRPWIIWSLIFLIAIMAKSAVMALRIYHDPFDVWASLLSTLKIVYLYSNYWFIINFLICIGILLMFKRRLYSWKLGVALLACTLFYSINVYFEWIEPIHTTALFGFVFFLWLGAQMHKNWEMVERKIRTMPLLVFTGMFLMTLALTMAETHVLLQRHSIEPYNTLRVTNLLYSLAVFALLVKIRDFNLLSYFKPRETTFGIYLIHYIIIYNILPEILIHLDVVNAADMSLAGICTYQYSRFIITYVVTFFIVKGINTTRFKWIIGNTVKS
ncbi:acyltransferase family protein [Mucilaginibacter boryungensis]|uniref:Acyltransferase n=1 Tax=Mucilaginibacter boryungensis TaxID=768480 RepID=A0ABR9XBX6_9SPHI|nr:acyltransferase [Mucilaginibacter boryungensis]MBE9664868.1 acyltransferase [Mucilaginibacter boryungensis]